MNESSPEILDEKMVEIKDFWAFFVRSGRFLYARPYNKVETPFQKVEKMV